MCTEKELEFSIFVIYQLAEKWKKHRRRYIIY